MIDLSKDNPGFSHKQILQMLDRRSGMDLAEYRVEALGNKVAHVCWLDYTRFQMRCDADSAVKYSASMTVKDDPRIHWNNDFIRLVMFYPVGNTALRFNFVPVKPRTISEDIGDGTVWRTLEAYDETIMLKGNTLGDIVFFQAGTPYMTPIKKFMVDAGFSNISIPSSNKTLATDRAFEPGEDRLELVNTLLSEINYTDIEVDKNGSILSAKYERPGIHNASIRYGSGNHGLIKSEKSMERDEISRPNHFVGYCANPDMDTDLRFSFTNISPGDPTSTVNSGYTITQIRQYDNVPDYEALGERVMKWRDEVSQSYRYGSFETAIMPHHGVHDVITLNAFGMEGIWQESSWMIDAVTKTMKHTARSVSFDG